jgi:hypothetical protein
LLSSDFKAVWVHIFKIQASLFSDKRLYPLAEITDSLGHKALEFMGQLGNSVLALWQVAVAHLPREALENCSGLVTPLSRRALHLQHFVACITADEHLVFEGICGLQGLNFSMDRRL